MIDYKLVLILVLSIVLLYLYNRVEALKDELKKQKKEQEEQKNILKKLEIENANIKLKIENLEKSMLARANVSIAKNTKVEEKKKVDVNCVDGVCKMPEKESINKVNISLMNDKNTTEYSATENDSESESITISTDNIVLYSNDKSDKSDNDLKKLNEENEIEEEQNEIEFIENIEISTDLEKDNRINLENNTLEEIINVESLIDKLGDEAVIFNKTINLDLNSKPSDYIEIIDSSNSIEDESNLNLDNIEFQKDNIKSYSDLDYENENQNESSVNSKSILEDLNKYKLNELQSLAKEHNIEITTLKNGKIKNKTKKELYTELVKIN